MEGTPTPHASSAPTPDVEVSEDQATFRFSARTWRVRGLSKNLSHAQLKVNVLVTLPRELVNAIEKVSSIRSGFLARAAERELRRRERIRRRRELDALAALPEQRALLETGLAEWAAGLPQDETASMVDPNGGTHVRWVEGLGWVEGEPAK